MRPPESPVVSREEPPRASAFAFLTLMVSLLITSFMLGGNTPSEVARQAAYGVGIGLILYVLIDLVQGFESVLRLDNVVFLSLYALLFVEFLFPQHNFDDWRTVADTVPSVKICLLGFAMMAVGNQIQLRSPKKWMQHVSHPISSSDLWLLFCACLLLAYLYKLMSVDFNPVAMIEAFFNNRWSRPWARGKFGGWTALLSELALFAYLVPPVAGVIFSKANEYSRIKLVLVSLGTILVIFDGFASGTRNVFAAYVISMVAAWSYFQFLARKYLRLIVVCSLALVVTYLAFNAMLVFRNTGLRNYLAAKGSVKEAMLDPSQDETIFVDYNLNTICELMRVFPDEHKYLGWEIPYNGLIRPIPRAFFPWKPEGLSISIEEACGVSGMTLSCTYIGEAYISGGWFGVVVYSLFLGIFARWGTQFVAMRQSEYGIMIFASLAFALAVAMRSFMTFTTMLLPSVAIFAFAWYRRRKKGHS